MQRNLQFKTSHQNGLYYFVLGCKLAFNSDLKRYVFLPILANIMIMSLLCYWLFSFFADLVFKIMDFVPFWINWLGYVILALVVFILAIFFCYFFSAITNLIAAPFNGLLAERVEAKLTGMPMVDNGWWGLISDLPRIIGREIHKLIHYLLWSIVILCTAFIPIVGESITPIVWLLFTAWQLTIQYSDYAFDNHKIPFRNMKKMLRQDMANNLTFGTLISIFTLLPLFNLIIMPIAVCGATAIWVDKYRKQALYEHLN